jgi:TctA family transporter
MAYTVERRLSRTPDEFGKGAIEGVSAPEAANNSAIQTAFVPTLTLGIPGDAVMALMLGMLLMHGITPGPSLLQNDPLMFWGLVASFLVGNAILLVLNLPLIGLWIRLVSAPYRYLAPFILGLVCIGTYIVGYQKLDILVVMAFGALGLVFFHTRIEPAPVILGFVLGPMIEEHFRRSLLISRGDFTTFLDRPISGTILAICALLVLLKLYDGRRRRRAQAG